MILRHYLPIAIVLALTLLSPLPARAQQAAATSGTTREITQVSGDLYLARDGQECTVFVVTADGIVLGDPLGREAALWLRNELKARFRKDVRFVLHTSHHYTRAAGSSVFNDTAEIVAQLAFNAELVKAQDAQPAHYRFAIRTSAGFAQTRLITLGGRTVGLFHVPSSQTPEMAVLLFPRERVVFAATLPGSDRVPFSFGALSPGDVLAWIDTLAPLEFDSLVLGDGRTVSRADFDELSKYLSALRGAVVTGVREVRTLPEVQSTATVDQFRTSPHYANRASQLSDLYAAVDSSVVRASAGAATSYVQLSSAFCASRTSCSGGGAVPALRITISVPARRKLDALAEVTLSGQTWSTRTSPSADQEAAGRRSRGALLLRWTPRPSRFSYGLVGGLSMTVDRVKGVDHVKGKLLPAGGNHPIDERNFRIGATVGFDLERTLSRGVTIRVPVRVTRTLPGKVSAYLDSTFDVQAGIDVTLRLFHRVSFR